MTTDAAGEAPVDRPVGRLVPERKERRMNPMHDPASYNVCAADRCGLGAILLLNLFERLKCVRDLRPEPAAREEDHARRASD